MITVLYKKIENFSENEINTIVNSLSESAFERLNKKRNEDLHLASLNALSLLTSEQRTDLDYTESGRPHFTTLNADISISHSKTYVAIAISSKKDKTVGVDIENNSMQTKSTRFLAENEQIALQKGTPYLEIWTKKEALFKYLKNNSLTLISLDSTMPEIYGAKFVTFTIDDNVLTVCINENTTIELIQK